MLQIVGAGPVTYCVAVVVVVTVYAGPINPVAVVPDSIALQISNPLQNDIKEKPHEPGQQRAI